MNDQLVPSPAKYAQIIDAAVAEFQEKGFAAASMDRVSARAEVSKRTVYKYFESKENLFRSIVDFLSERFADMREIRYEAGRPIKDQLTALAQAEGRLLTSPQVIAMSRMLISETLRNPAVAQAGQGKLDKTPAFVDMMRAAADAGQLKLDDPVDAAHEFLGLIKAKAFWPAIFGAEPVSQDRMDEIVESSVDFIMCRYGV